MTTISLARISPLLPATRAARAEVVYQLLQNDGGEASLSSLAFLLVRQYRGDSFRTWSAAQLEQAVNDLAGADLVTVAARRGGDLRVAAKAEITS